VGEIKGDKYKLAGIDVFQKGTLVEVFAKFATLDETLEDITAPAPAKQPGKAKPGTMAAVLEQLTPLPRSATLPSLSVEDITDALVGPRNLQRDGRSHLQLTDKSGVIADLGPEKLASVLVEMGAARRKVLEEGQSTFVPLMKPKGI
jgi:hypothetical protein